MSRRSSTLAAWLLMPLLLAACGGGSSDEPTSVAATATPAAVITQLRAKAAAVAVDAVAPEEAARQLMDFGEATFPAYFPTHATTRSSPPFVFRYYPETGIYLGVVVTAGMGYEESGVYVMGGAFGSQPVLAGPLSSFITPVHPGPAATPTAIVIDKPWVFLPASGQSTQLTAQAIDAQGAVSAVNVTWTSSAPGKVSVDSAGRLTAMAVGSAQLFAQSAGVRSAPTLVVVAEPRPGALLVTDAQVLAVGAPLGLPAGTPAAVGAEYEVTLEGVAAPAPGTIVLAAETAPIAGKVVATRQDAAGLVVRLALVPLNELLSNYDIDWRIELSAFALQPVPSRGAAAAQGAVWKRALGSAQREPLAATRRDASEAFPPFKRIDCEASLKPELIDAKIQLAPDIDLKLDIIDRPGYSKHALVGSATLNGSVGVTLQVGFKASGKCEAAHQFKLPVFGWASMIIMPAVRFGVGIELNGELRLVQGEFGVEGKIGFSPILGWECGGETPTCRGLDQITPVDELKTKSKIPTRNDMQVKIDAQFYILAGLDASLLLGAGNARLVEARVGPKQSFDLGFEDDQAARSDYASSYDLKLEGVVEPGSALQDAIKKVIGDDTTTLKFSAKFSKDISESPKGSLAVNRSRVAVGSPVDFTVVLDPKTTEYFLLGYNVTGVELYRKKVEENEFKPWKSMPTLASNQTTFTYQWQTTVDEVGTFEFAALVNTQVLTPLLEISPNSIQSVEVGCFSAGLSAGSGRRARAAAAGGRPVPLAEAACVSNSWTGTASVEAKTPGLPQASITARSNVTWTVDPSQSGYGATVYKPSGSFSLKIKSPLDCTIVLLPSTFAIVDDPFSQSRLVISDYGFTAPTYGFMGSQLVDFTSRMSCPGQDDVVSRFTGFQVVYASGHGEFSDPLRLFGTYEDGAITTAWSFPRPAGPTKAQATRDLAHQR